MKLFPLTAIAAALMLSTPIAQAQQHGGQLPAFSAGNVSVTLPWARATPGSAPVAGGFLTIANSGAEPDRLIGGSSDIASKLEVHEMSMDNGVMKMRPVDGGLEVKPGASVELKPGGYHIMFLGLKHGLKEGERFKAQLEFAKGGKTEVEFVVRGIGATTPMDAPAGHMH